MKKVNPNPVCCTRKMMFLGCEGPWWNVTETYECQNCGRVKEQSKYAGHTFKIDNEYGTDLKCNCGRAFSEMVEERGIDSTEIVCDCGKTTAYIVD